MKKSLLALAVLGAFAGVASAQSSVTLYGTIDLSAKYVKNEGSDKRLSLSQDGINSSQLGFKGVEDLGGGLKASFVLLAGLNVDTGTTNSKFFNRRATVSLSGGFGEIRLGRDYTPTFWNDTIFDAFGTNGLGDSSHVLQIQSPSFVRADNSIGYFLPAIGGLYGQVMAAAAEGGTAANGTSGQGCTITGAAPAVPGVAPTCSTFVGSNQGRYLGGRIGFAAGPFDVAFAAADQRFTTGLGNIRTYNIGGSYDLGVVKLLGYFDRDTQNDSKENRFSVSAVVPLGQGEIHVGYDRSKLTNDGVKGAAAVTGIDNVASQYKVGYVYNLSKRTAVYTNASRLNNGDGSGLSVAGGTAQTASPILGGKSTGVEFGVRHFF